MTEQIKSALEVLGTYDMSDDNDDTEFKDSISLAIRSLQAWSEVLNELEELKQNFKDDRKIHDAIAVNISIKRIKEHLAEIEERNLAKLLQNGNS